MTQEEVERLLEDKIMKGELAPGLYDCGLQYVTAQLGGEDGDAVLFTWYSHCNTLDLE